MIRSLAPAATAAALALIAGPTLAAQPVERLWFTEGGDAKVRIAPCPAQADRLCGTIAWVKEPSNPRALDSHNPNPALKTRPLLGVTIISGFVAADADHWKGGKIYDPDTGYTFDSKMALNANGTLKVSGCVLVLCKAQTWTPAKD